VGGVNPIEITIKFAFDPDLSDDSRYDSFEMNFYAGDTVLSASIRIYEDFDSSLSFGFACGKMKCGERSIMASEFPWNLINSLDILHFFRYLKKAF
jgi:succinate dehydrogenase/fumarate reductase-like Fe-S protein